MYRHCGLNHGNTPLPHKLEESCSFIPVSEILAGETLTEGKRLAVTKMNAGEVVQTPLRSQITYKSIYIIILID